MSSLPLGLNQIEIQRGLTTSSVAIFVPFTTQELFQTGSEALYYGINALSNNLIMVDRKLLKNPNGLILGTPGSGKSFSAKREITNAFLICPKDDIIICDPEAEYAPLVNRLGVQAIFCNGATSGRLYRKYAQPLTGLEAVVLPSTSPANAAFTMPRLLDAWGTALEGYVNKP